MQPQDPPAPDGDERPADGAARHRRPWTDPPVPPRTAADYVTRRRGDADAGTPPPPWAHDRADPHGTLTSGPRDEPVSPSVAWSPAFTETFGSADEPPTVWPPAGSAARPGPGSSDGPPAEADPAPGTPAPGGTPAPAPGVRGRPYTEVDAAPDPDGEPEHGTAAWFGDDPPASPATGVPGVPPGGRTPVRTGAAPDAGPADPPFGSYAVSGRLRAAPPTPAGAADDDPGDPGDPGDPPPRPVPRPRPSPGPRHPAPTPAPAGRAPERSTGTGPAVGHPDRGPAGGHPDRRPAGAQLPPETTGPVLDRPIRDDDPTHAGGRPAHAGTTASGAHAAVDAAARTGPRRDGVTGTGSHRATGPSADTAVPVLAGADGRAPSTGADPGTDGVGPRSRRALRPEVDRSRRVSDVARERGLPVRELAEPPAAAAGTGHGHGHGHAPATPAGKRVRILLAALLVPCALAALAGVALLWPGTSPVPAVPPQQQVEGTVQAVQAADCTPGTGSGGCTGVTIRMTDGPRAGSDLVQLVPAEPSTPRFAVGDAVVMSYSGGNPDEAGSYQITDFQRDLPLAWLAAAFAVAVLILGRWRGLAALVALGLSFTVLVLFVLPSILSGNNPLAVAVTGAGVIMFVVLYLSHGFSARTSCAVLGTLISLALIGGLGALFTATTRLTGLDDTTSNLIGTIGNVPIDARGLVLAGLVIGALGVLDDVTVTQASAVWEVRDANPSLRAGTLFAAGMRIGRDHVSSAVNTLVLAYAGAALPLMLLFTASSASVTQVVTSQDVATEIVRTLVGSIGLVASVPLTTGLAAVAAARR